MIHKAGLVGFIQAAANHLLGNGHSDTGDLILGIVDGLFLFLGDVCGSLVQNGAGLPVGLTDDLLFPDAARSAASFTRRSLVSAATESFC